MIAQANRGAGFERLLVVSNTTYAAHGLAVVQKVPTPTKVLQSRGGVKVVREKSTVDFVGVIRGGRMVAFDAKENRTETRFQFDDRWEHEVEFIRSVIECGGAGFFLIDQIPQGAVYLVPGARLIQLWDEAQRGGRKSIPLDMLQTFPVVGRSPGVPVDWLAAVKKEVTL